MPRLPHAPSRPHPLTQPLWFPASQGPLLGPEAEASVQSSAHPAAPSCLWDSTLESAQGSVCVAYKTRGAHSGHGHFLLLQLPETLSARRPSCTCSSRASTTRPPALWMPATRSRKPTPKVRRARGPLGPAAGGSSGFHRAPVFSGDHRAIGWQGGARALISELAPFRLVFASGSERLLPLPLCVRACVADGSSPGAGEHLGVGVAFQPRRAPRGEENLFCCQK